MEQLNWDKMTAEELATEYFLILNDIMVTIQSPFSDPSEQLETIEAQVRQVPQFKEV